MSVRDRGGLALAKAVRGLYSRGQTDYSLDPLVRVGPDGEPMGRICDGDSVVFCCRRGEREVELTEAFTQVDFPHFPHQTFHDLSFVILTLYHEKFKDLPVAFAPTHIQDTLGEAVSRAGLRQLRVAESEKFAHVTFFFNGGSSIGFNGEEDCRIPSPQGVPFDQAPEMSLPEVSQQVIAGISQGFDLIVTNFANGDAVGHTSSCEAKIRCAEAVDRHLGRVIDEAVRSDYVVIITADHGNLEEMVHPDGTPHVSHTTNQVPLILIDPRSDASAPLPHGGALCDIAPTVLQALGLPQPDQMSGASLLDGYHWQGKRRVLLVILDGWGTGRQDQTNPIYLAYTPNWDKLLKTHAFTLLQASGEAVGLQPRKAGNSEAGHMNIGAGRVVTQDDARLDQAMQDGTFYSNQILCEAIDSARKKGRSLHLIALLSEKSSHGSIDYPLSLLKMAKSAGLERVYLHLIFDGRSTEPGSAPDLLEKLDRQMCEIGVGQIVSGIGRGLALDRDGNYAKVQKAYDAFVFGRGECYSAS
jgi:2,3-bisphosphoglycerate-independent phosphoglycerate mutase